MQLVGTEPPYRANLLLGEPPSRGLLYTRRTLFSCRTPFSCKACADAKPKINTDASYVQHVVQGMKPSEDAATMHMNTIPGDHNILATKGAEAKTPSSRAKEAWLSAPAAGDGLPG